MKRLNKPSFTNKYPNLIFWSCYLTLNVLLFLPLYLLNRETTTFFPSLIATRNQPFEATRQLVLWRDNLDIFRLNSELLLFVALWVFVPWLRRAFARRLFRWLGGLIYFTILIYAIFESALRTLYQVDPAFYSHFQLAVDGIQVLVRNLKLPLSLVLLTGLGLVAVVICIGGLISLLIGGVAVEQLSRWSKGGLALLTCLVLVYVVGFQDFLANPMMQVSSFIYKLQKNIAASTEVYRRVQDFDDAAAQTEYDYTGYTLRQKPNIHLISVESYGSVLYKRPDYREAYTALLADLDAELQTHNWHAASALSEAPTWGGGSWMSYTSILFGLHIDAQPQYLSLLNQYQKANYPDLGHFLKSQDYTYIRLSSLSAELSKKKQQELKNFYGVDQWSTYSDLDFHGQNFGWGPAPPDQYALFYAREYLLDTGDTPFFFFYVTQNSHFPWNTLPEVVDDWRNLNQPSGAIETTQSSVVPHEVKRQNYLNSIDYELRVLTNYIVKTGNNNDIFILIGDHQPPQVSRPNDSFATPIHIISQDAIFLDAFLDHGFVSGLMVEDEPATMRHEGLYSLFVRLLLAQYGDDVQNLPDYLPRGVMIGDEQVARETKADILGNVD